MGKFCLWFSKFSQDSVAQIRAHQYQIFFIKLWLKFCQYFHYYHFIIMTQNLPLLKFHIIYFKMHSSFLHGLKVSSHCEVLPNLFRVARKFSACPVSLLVLYHQLEWYFGSIYDSKTGCKCSTAIFLRYINIVLLDHIKMMAVTVARSWSINSQLLMNLVIISLILTSAGHI